MNGPGGRRPGDGLGRAQLFWVHDSGAGDGEKGEKGTGWSWHVGEAVILLGFITKARKRGGK